MTKALIVHAGIITAIGNNCPEQLAALESGKAGISFPEILQTVHDFPVGEIKKTNEALAAMIAGRADAFPQGKGIKKVVLSCLPRTALLSILAAQEAWAPFVRQAGGLKVGFVSANTVGGMDKTEHFYQAFRKDKASGDLNEVRYHECGAITALTREALGLQGWSTTISTACSSSANSIMMAARLIEQGRLDIAIAGGADSLSRFTLNGFNTLMILDKAPSRPFDEHRKGLNLGEGAAYLVLVSESVADKWKTTPLAYLSGYANANDAHHQTASSPEGKGNRMAMLQALQKAGLHAADIDYINLHGTGTENNDASEGIAIEALFGDCVPAASSTKTFTGHTLGAAGAVEAVFSLMSIREKKTWPHLRLQTPMHILGWRPETRIQDKKIRHVLSNSFGFGGNCSTLILSAV